MESCRSRHFSDIDCQYLSNKRITFHSAHARDEITKVVKAHEKEVH